MADLKINKKFAEKYDKYRQKEELQKRELRQIQERTLYVTLYY